ncbi:ABC transporter permease [Cyanobium sp. CH-040]|nr:ABC transporter permease [Cyanobium sp. CH-040]
MRLAHVRDLGLKELRSLLRERFLLVLILIAFTVSVVAGTRASPETLRHTPIAIVDEDRSPLSMRIAGAFLPPYFQAPQLVDAAGMERRLELGQDTFGLDIPPQFQRDVLAGRQPVVQLNVDATRIGQAFSGSTYVQAIVQREVRRFLGGEQDPPAAAVQLVSRARFNPGLSKVWFGSIMQVINQVTMLSLVLSGAALVRERDRGTLEHLLAMPVTPLEIMLAKAWSMGLVVLLAAAGSLVVVVQGVLQVPLAGSLPLFLLGTGVHLFATTSMGILIATLARSMPQFGLLLLMVLLPLQMLSGSITPRESMPAWVQLLMLLAPNTHYVMLGQGILYRGAGLATLWPEFLILLSIGSLFFLIALARFRRSVGSLG